MIDVHCPKGGRHEFDTDFDHENTWFFCVKCGENRYVEDVVHYVNAAMQLTADEAEALAKVHTSSDGYIDMYGMDLSIYASRWRGNTEAQDES